MLLPILWLVAAFGAVATFIGMGRLRDPETYAKAIAKREQRKYATALDRKKSRSSGTALVVMGPMLVGLWAYVQFFMR